MSNPQTNEQKMTPEQQLQILVGRIRHLEVENGVLKERRNAAEDELARVTAEGRNAVTAVNELVPMVQKAEEAQKTAATQQLRADSLERDLIAANEKLAALTAAGALAKKKAVPGEQAKH